MLRLAHILFFPFFPRGLDLLLRHWLPPNCARQCFRVSETERSIVVGRAQTVGRGAGERRGAGAEQSERKNATTMWQETSTSESSVSTSFNESASWYPTTHCGINSPAQQGVRLCSRSFPGRRHAQGSYCHLRLSLWPCGRTSMRVNAHVRFSVHVHVVCAHSTQNTSKDGILWRQARCRK